MSKQITNGGDRETDEQSVAAVAMSLVVLGGDGDDRPGFMLGDSRLSLGAGAEDDVYLTGVGVDRKSTRLNSSHIPLSRMPSSA